MIAKEGYQAVEDRDTRIEISAAPRRTDQVDDLDIDLHARNKCTTELKGTVTQRPTTRALGKQKQITTLPVE